MTKAKISEYDAVAANNTDVNGVNIDEGCAPSGMNNMGREIMAALKRFETGADGDSLTVGGNLIVSGTSTVAALNTSGAVVFNDAGADVDFRVEGDTSAYLLFVDASTDFVGIGTNAPAARLHSETGLSSPALILQGNTDASSSSGTGTTIRFRGNANAGDPWEIFRDNGVTGDLVVAQDVTGTRTERMRITSGGDFLVGTTSNDTVNAGLKYDGGGNGALKISRASNTPFFVNRITNDGVLIQFRQDDANEGDISVSGSTVSYNGGHLSRYAQTTTAKDASLRKGTVLSNLDEMNVYVKPTLYWTEDDELPVDEEGNSTVAVGDVKQETSVSDNEQLNKVKVSDVEGDPNVAGVFVNWAYDEAHQVDEINMAMTGDMIIRIAEGVTVARGDLLMSAGDGTAKPQGDDIVRSKTIAKVTSTHVTCTYEDGSYCVPCVLMAC
jgi:hypothetical protein